MTSILRVVLAAFLIGPFSSSTVLHAADEQAAEAAVEGVVEDLADDDEEEVEGADPGEASYNTEDCEQPGEAAGDRVEADDLDEECAPLIK